MAFQRLPSPTKTSPSTALSTKRFASSLAPGMTPAFSFIQRSTTLNIAFRKGELAHIKFYFIDVDLTCDPATTALSARSTTPST